jgi:hypothetical protein
MKSVWKSTQRMMIIPPILKIIRRDLGRGVMRAFPLDMRRGIPMDTRQERLMLNPNEMTKKVTDVINMVTSAALALMFLAAAMWGMLWAMRGLVNIVQEIMAGGV